MFTMWIQQMFIASICTLLISQQATAVINSGPKTKAPTVPTSTSTTNVNSESSDSDSASGEEPIAASSEKEANKREAIVGLTDSFSSVGLLDGIYGPPIDSYIPPAPSNLGLPVPVYGVPNIGSNQIYPAPPADIPPPIPTLSLSYGVPNSINIPFKDYGPPKNIYLQSKPIYGPPKQSYGPPRTKYGPPHLQRPPKPFNSQPFLNQKGVKPFYGPPRYHKPHFQKLPKPLYGPPKPHYGPPKIHFAPPQVHSSPQPLLLPPTASGFLNPPPLTDNYGPPNIGVHVEVINDISNGRPAANYGPPEPVPHGPPHPGIPAPPTPPDITYDGWRPIAGLVSRPPSNAYGAPHGQHHHGSGDLHINGDFTPPPVGGAGLHSLSLQDSYKGNGVLRDSYGAPLNSVTGSGGTSSASGEEHHHQGQNQQSHQQSLNIGYEQQSHSQQSIGFVGHSHGHHHHHHGQHNDNINIGYEGQSNSHQQQHHHGQHNDNINIGYEGHSNSHQQQQHQGNIDIGLSAIGLAGQDNSLSVVKSVGYELFPNVGNFNYAPGSNYGAPFDTYGAPPPSSYSSDGPYAAAQTFNTNSLSQSSFSSSFGSSGSFGKSLSSNGLGLIPPSGLYGVAPSSQYGTPLFQPSDNFNVNVNQPKNPVVFRDNVHNGLIESSLGQKDVIIENSHQIESTYIPPDISKPVKEQETPELFNLYSLPSVDRPISFQEVVHGSATAGLGSQFSNNFRYNNAHDGFAANGAQAAVVSSYAAPLGSVDANYALPLQAPALNVDQIHNNGFHVEQSHGFNAEQSHNFAANNFNTNVGLDFNSLSGGYNVQNVGSFQNIPHDCSSHTSQPLPHLTYGVPLRNGYSEAHASLNNNIGGVYQIQPSLVYGTPDLQASHSQEVGVSSNTLRQQSNKDVYGKSLGESFAGGGEVVQSQSLDLNNIPVQGALGSYTLQIQSADGLGSSGSSSHIQHDQVLNDGLLRSILAAIEQPQQNANILGQPLIQIPAGQENVFTQITNPPVINAELNSEFEKRSDGAGDESVKNVVVVPSPVTEATTIQSTAKTETTQTTEANTNDSLQLIDDNEIALFYSNNSGTDKETSGVNHQQNNGSKANEVRNAQQYGSYVSFNTPKASYVYGDLKSSESEKTPDIKK